MKAYKNYSIEECAKTVAPLVTSGRADFFMKFTCAKCWSRQVCEEPNKFFTTARCDQCGHVSDISKDGCNYLLALKVKV